MDTLTATVCKLCTKTPSWFRSNHYFIDNAESFLCECCVDEEPTSEMTANGGIRQRNTKESARLHHKMHV